MSQSETPELIFYQAVDLMGEGKLSEADQLLSDAIRRFPAHLDFYEALARLCDRTDQDSRGIELCTQWATLDPLNPMTMTNLSVFEQKLGHIDAAEVAKAQATTLQMKKSMAEAKAKRSQ